MKLILSGDTHAPLDIDKVTEYLEFVEERLEFDRWFFGH